MLDKRIEVIAFFALVTWSLAAGGSAADWVAPDPGLLRDANFDAVQRGERSPWGTGQHAGKPSYRFQFEPGLLEIERIGPEPWGQARQRIPASGLVGRTLVFSAELSGSLSASAQHATASSTGLAVRVRGYRPGMPTYIGKAIMLTADALPEIGPGDHEWTPQAVRFEVPEGATDIEVSFRLTMLGKLAVRGPSLVVVEPDGAGSP